MRYCDIPIAVPRLVSLCFLLLIILGIDNVAVLFTNASTILCTYAGHCHDTKLMRRRMPNMLETTPDRPSDHSFGIIVHSRAAVAIAKIPVMIDHVAMNDSRMSVICAVHLVRFSSLRLPDGRMIHHRTGHAQLSSKPGQMILDTYLDTPCQRSCRLRSGL